MIINIIIVFVSFLCIVLTQFFKKRYNYWKEKGINGPKPLPFVGNFGQLMLYKENIEFFLKRIYMEYPKERVVGLYQGPKPVLLLKDPEIIKQVVVKDFTIFQDRGLTTNTELFLSKNLFFLEGEQWSIVRPKLNPIFTPGKLKNMMPLIDNAVNKFISYLHDLTKACELHEVKALTSKYTLQAITSCAFGSDMNFMVSEKTQFETIANEIIIASTKEKFWAGMDLIFPGIRNVFPNISETSQECKEFFSKVVAKIIEDRQGQKDIRKDFMDFLIKIKENDKVLKIGPETEIAIDDEFMAAQAFVFYAAGFETSATTMAFLLYELALNQDIQDRLYEEINAVYDKYNGKIPYEALGELSYAEMVFDETLRKYPVLGFLARQSQKDYTIPDINLNIKKGTQIFVSISGLHQDKKYFRDPKKFDPENFSPENKKHLPPCVYIPFGDGPRYCIGKRFAKIQSLYGIAVFLKNFKVLPSERTEKEIIMNPSSVTMSPLNGIWLKINNRNSN